MEPVIEATTVDDPALQELVAAQEQEVMARYGMADAGPGLSATSPCLLARLDGVPVGCVALGSLGDGVRESECDATPSAAAITVGSVPLYRLVNAQGVEIRRFEEPDDAAGVARGRAIGLELFGPHGHPITAHRADLGVERQDGERWTFFAGWMPRPPA